MGDPARHTCQPVPCIYLAVATTDLRCRLLQLRTFQARRLQNVAVSTGVKARLLSFEIKI